MDLGKCDTYKLKIDTGDAQPRAQRPYPTNAKMREEISRQVQEMEAQGIIEPSTSEWAAPPVMVKKKNGKLRFACDLRRLNAVTKPISYPMPTLQNVFDAMGEAKPQYLTTLDLAHGFWQLELDQETKHKTAFVTHQGKWESNRMPFGLVNAPAAFQMTMNQVLRGLTWDCCLVYIDDVAVYSRTWENHLDHLRKVFNRFRECNLKLQPSKCQIATEKVLYLGHQISKNGIEVDSTKTKALDTYPAPKTTTELRSFLGLANFYRRFVPNFSAMAAPLNKLLRKDVPYVWSNECSNSFQAIKTALTEPTVLAHADTSKDFIVRTDASMEAIGYVLNQLDERWQ